MAKSVSPFPDPGAFRHLVSYQEISASLDEMNETVNTWVTLTRIDNGQPATYWGFVEPLQGMELMNAGQEKGISKGKITMWNVDSTLANGIRPTGRFLFEGTGRILYVYEDFQVGEQNAYLSIRYIEYIQPQ